MANKIEKQFLDTENKGPVRLNKYLSEAGVCSRREADKLIAADLTHNTLICSEIVISGTSSFNQLLLY